MEKVAFCKEEERSGDEQAAHCKNDKGTDVADPDNQTKGCGNKGPKNQDKKKCIQHDDPASLARWRKVAPPAGMKCQG